MLEILFWYLLTSALGDAAITRIRVLLFLITENQFFVIFRDNNESAVIFYVNESNVRHKHIQNNKLLKYAKMWELVETF